VRLDRLRKQQAVQKIVAGVQSQFNNMCANDSRDLHVAEQQAMPNAVAAVTANSRIAIRKTTQATCRHGPGRALLLPSNNQPTKREGRPRAQQAVQNTVAVTTNSTSALQIDRASNTTCRALLLLSTPTQQLPYERPCKQQAGQDSVAAVNTNQTSALKDRASLLNRPGRTPLLRSTPNLCAEQAAGRARLLPRDCCCVRQ
jgi:hypothetical protein